MKPTNEALKNYQISDISYDKNANLATATFTEELTSNDKSSLKEIIIDIFGVKPGWIGHNGLTLNIPEKEFNNFQKLLILDLQMKLQDEEVTNEAESKKVNRNSFVPIGAMVKDFKESWNSKEMNREAKLVPGGEWVDVETGGDSEMMVCITSEMKKALPKDDGLFVMTVGDLMWDQDKKDFVTILTDNKGNEKAVWLQKGKGLEEIEQFMDANESVTVPVVESFSSVLKNMISEAKDTDDNDIAEGDEVIVVGHTDQEGKKGVIVETSDSSDFVIVEIKGKNYSYHASDLKKIDEEEDDEDYEEEDEDAERTYEYVIDLDERGDFQAHIEDSDGDVVYEIDGLDDLMSIIEDGFMKDKNDTDGLLQHLIDVGELPKDAILENLDTKIDKFLSKINEDFGDDDQLALDNSEPEYEVIVATEGPRDNQTAHKVAKKLEIPGSPDTGFIVSTKVLLRKFVNTLRGFDLAVSKILDGHNNEVALASIEAYKPKGRPTNKYNYPNRMRENKTNEAFRDGSGSHFDSLLKGWAKENGVEYEMKFKDTRGKKNVPYFVLKLNYEQYDALPTEAKTALNGLMKRFGVDFSYRNKTWTPIIESVMNESKLIKGEALTPEQKKMVFAAYIYRNTKENEQNVRRFLKDKADSMKFEQSDEQWVKDHAFKFSNDGKKLTGKYAEPAYLAD